MTRRDRRELERYIRHVADEMELRDWTITLSDESAPGDALGHVTNTYGRKLATIKVCTEFRSLLPAQQRHTIAHELTHCHLESACNIVLNDLEEHLGKQADRILWDGFKRQMEYGVDAISEAIAKHMPLIDWPT